jgi:hypothetical protein
MKDKHGNEIKIGDIINITGLETKVIGFDNIEGQSMVSTDYGDFNADLVEKVSSPNSLKSN